MVFADMSAGLARRYLDFSFPYYPDNSYMWKVVKIKVRSDLGPSFAISWYDARAKLWMQMSTCRSLGILLLSM